MRRTRTFSYTCAGLLGLALIVSASAPSTTKPPDVYFLRGGEIWRTTDGGSTLGPVTSTKGMIQRFEISRHGRYVAYEVVVDSAEDAGDYEPGETIPKTPVAQIVVAELRTLRTLEMIGPDLVDSSDPFVYMDRWLAPELLTFHTANGIEVVSLFAYDAARNTTAELQGTEGFYLAKFSDETLDGRLRVRMESDVGNDHLILEDLTSGENRELLRANAFALALSPDGRTVAGIDDVNWPSGYRRLWVADLERPLLRQVAAVPFEGLSVQNTGLAWSADGRHLLAPWGHIVSVADSSRHRSLAGTGFVWYASDIVLATQGRHVFAMEVDSGVSRTFIDDATNVRVAPR
jgi:hypothetical protein